MAGSSKTNRKKGNVKVEHECSLNLLPRDIWVRIATMVASNSIQDLFNMQVTSKGLTKYFWIARRGIGMELLARDLTEGSIEAGYLFGMLLLCDHEDEEEVQRGVEILDFIHTSRKVERCKEFFTDIFSERWVDETPSDPGHAVACRSTTCTTCGTMADVNDLSRVSCVDEQIIYTPFGIVFRYFLAEIEGPEQNSDRRLTKDC
ncbi:hypothetical protein AHAS_Ahas08G0047600 [Arachis hypogaea]